MRAILKGQHVTLLPLCDGDMPRRACWTADAELASLIGAALDPDESKPSPKAEVRRNREWLRRRHESGAKPYAIEVGGRYVGDIDFRICLDEKKADLTVFIGERTHWRKGYGTEAVGLVMDELFAAERAEVVEVDVVPWNQRALRFWRKLGFVEVGADARGAQLMRLSRNKPGE